jgi:sialate O-acetylesterase
MVLQRNKPIRIWGWASPSAEITCELNNRSASITAGKNGTWLLQLPSMNTGGPYTLKISDKKKQLIFTDIMIGEVWICSGQSNMEWPLIGSKNCPVENSQNEIKNAEFPNIRLIKIPKKPKLHPQYDIPKTPWNVCTPKTAAPFSAVAYFFGRKLYKELNVPIGLILSAWGGTPCQSWSSEKVIENFPKYQSWLAYQLKNTKQMNSWTPSSLYNAMIQPLIPMSIAGFIWYQGEANRKNPKEYLKLFPAMINDWRKNFKQGDLPFYYCQIAPFNYKEKDAGVQLRDVQLKALKKLPNLGMVVLSDKTNIENIHPPYKKDAGERLAFWALNKVYSKDVPYSGPLFNSYTIKGDTIIVNFDYGEGLNGSLKEFEIAGKDKKFYPANAEIDGDTIRLKSPDVPEPTLVRYAWSNTATGGLFNKNALPASSFTTEK